MRNAETRSRRGRHRLLRSAPRPLVLLTLICALTAVAADTSQSGAPSQSPVQVDPATLPPATPWLDEVRNQRQIWEERRHSAREAFEERRRRQSPRGATQQDAWKEDIKRRREARRQQMEQEREYYRNLAPNQGPPWAPPIEPLPASPLPLAPEQPRPTLEPDATIQGHPGPAAGGIEPLAPPPPHTPQDWDNLWYFRGF